MWQQQEIASPCPEALSETVSTSLLRQIGQSDASCREAGGFVIARTSLGSLGYFPVGQPVNVNGRLDHGARIVEAWCWISGWRRVYPLPETS
jgi:hypothetical protein